MTLVPTAAFVIVAFSQTDFTEDLKKIAVPVLVMHGDDDQSVPYADSATASIDGVRRADIRQIRTDVVYATARRLA